MFQIIYVFDIISSLSGKLPKLRWATGSSQTMDSRPRLFDEADGQTLNSSVDSNRYKPRNEVW